MAPKRLTAGLFRRLTAVNGPSAGHRRQVSGASTTGLLDDGRHALQLYFPLRSSPTATTKLRNQFVRSRQELRSPGRGLCPGEKIQEIDEAGAVKRL